MDANVLTARIDTGKAHDSRYATKVEMLYLVVVTGNAQVPLLAISSDHFINPVNDSTNARMCQSVDGVSVDGNSFTITNSLSQRSETYNAKEQGWVYGDGFSVNVWNGWHTDRNASGTPSGTQRPPTFGLGSSNTGFDETGGKRVDIRRTGGTENSVLVARGLTEQGNSIGSPIYDDRGDVEELQMIGIRMLSSKTHQFYSSISVQGGGRTIATCLEPGTYEDQNGNTYNLKGGFLLDAVLPSGTINLQKT